MAEYEDAAVYYERCEEGLGGRFILEIDEAIALAQEFPAAGSHVEGAPKELDIRRRLLHTFPIEPDYLVSDGELLILAVFHTTRRPGYRFGRLKKWL